MVENRINIKQQFVSNDGLILQYGILINSSTKIESEKIRNNINNNIKNHETIPNIIELVMMIKNEIEDICPISLWVKFSKDKEFSEKVNYITNKLVNYTYQVLNPTIELEEIELNYDIENGINFHIKRNEKSKTITSLKIIREIIDDKMETIQKLEEVESINLSNTLLRKKSKIITNS